MTKGKVIKVPKKQKKIYKLSEGQIANVVLAARGQSGCDKAKRFVKDIEKKLHLPKLNKKK